MKFTTRKLAVAAVVGAAYAALTMLLAPISFGPLQFRVSEALCILPAFIPCTSWGLFVGCAIANLISSYGPLDIVFGSLATLGCALCVAAIGRGRLPISLPRAFAASLMPALWNAPIIGGVIAYSAAVPGAFWSIALVSGAQVGLGELGVMLVIGLPLCMLLSRSEPFCRISAYINGDSGEKLAKA